MELVMGKGLTTHSCCCLIVAVLLMHFIKNIETFSSTHCKTLEDWYPMTIPQSGPSPFLITSSTSYYSLSGLITVVLEGRNNESFVSYIIHGEDSKRMLVGHFEEMSLANCSYSTSAGLNRSSNQRFWKVKAHWRAPPVNSGKITFRASVAKDKGIYWNDVVSPIVLYKPASGSCHPGKDFKCADGHCIPFVWRCDEHDDCKDNSDEDRCHWKLPPGYETSTLLKVIVSVGILFLLMLITYCLRREISNRLNAGSRRRCLVCLSRSRRRRSGTGRTHHSTSDDSRDLSPRTPELNEEVLDESEASAVTLEGAPPSYEVACQIDLPPPSYEEALAREQIAAETSSANSPGAACSADLPLQS